MKLSATKRTNSANTNRKKRRIKINGVRQGNWPNRT